MDKFAFRCNNCRRLVDSAAAGERDFPASCPSCGAGVSFDPRSGEKQYHADNWLVLADLSAEELEAQRVVLKDGTPFEYWAKDEIKIVKHKAAPSTVPEGRVPQNISREVSDGIGVEDVVG